MAKTQPTYFAHGRSLRPALRSYRTLADLAALIDADTAMKRTDRLRVVHGLSAFASLLGKKLDQIEAIPHELQAKFARIEPVSSRVTRADLNKLRSCVRTALVRSQVTKAPARFYSPLMSKWATLLALLQKQADRDHLSRFAYYCSRRRILPSSVRDATLSDFAIVLEEESLLRNPKGLAQITRRTWNHGVDSRAEWPRTKLSIPKSNGHGRLPWEIFPATLQSDLLGYLEKLETAEVISDFPRGPLCPKTVKDISKLLRLFISSAVHGGCDPRTLTSASDLVQDTVVKAALSFLLGRLGGKPSNYIAKIAREITALARIWVKVGRCHLLRLEQLQRRLMPKRSYMADSTRIALRQFDSKENVLALLDAPRRIMANPALKGMSARQVARHAQAAVAIELLVVMPITYQKLMHLKLGENIQRQSDGKYRLLLKRAVNRKRRDIDVSLGIDTSKLLSTYISKHRATLSSTNNHFLFPGRGPRANGQVRHRIASEVLATTGLIVTPDLFRHFAAKHFLATYPTEFPTIRYLLGHNSLAYTETFYKELSTSVAFKSIDSRLFRPSVGDS